MRLIVGTVLATVLLGGFSSAAVAVEYDGPPEDYASYQPQTRCRDTARPGTRMLARWVNRRFSGGTASASVRPCSSGTSEHKDGRAIDWAMDAGKRADRREVRRFLDRLFATDSDGNAHARARRMGVMYVIWNDHMYASYADSFARRDYVSSSCDRLRSCSATLRHRDHVHISLSKPGGRGVTSWYTARR